MAPRIAIRDGQPIASASPVVGFTIKRALSQGSRTPAINRGVHWTAINPQTYAPETKGRSSSHLLDKA
jgi:hypothetical protein